MSTMVDEEGSKMSANEKQVAGNHYKTSNPDIPQHWDIVALHNLDYFQGQITKYVMRWKNKNGLQDLQKAMHFLEKYIELNTPKSPQEKYPPDYQDQLSKKMEKMRHDSMQGLRNELGRVMDPSEPQPWGYVNQDGENNVR